MRLRSTRYLAEVLIAFALLPAMAGGQVWLKLPSPASPAPNLAGAYFFNRDTGFACGEVSGAGKLYQTTNAGMSWSLVTLPGSPGPLNDINFAPGSSFGAIVGNSGYIAVSTNRGNTWTLQSSALASAWPSSGDINAVLFTSATTGFVVGAGITGGGPRFARTTNGGASWGSISLLSPANNLYDIAFFDSLRGMAIGTGQPPRASRSTDAGVSWTTRDSIGSRAATSLSFYGIDIAEGTGTAYVSGGKVILPGAYYPEVRKTTDYGTTWSITGLTSSGSLTSPGSDVFALNDNVAFVSARSGNVYLTTDGGDTWSGEQLPAGTGSYDLRKFSDLPDKRFYLVGFGGTVLRYEASPTATFSPDTLKYRLCPGTSQTLTLTVGNSGTGVLTVDSVRIKTAAGSQLNYNLQSPQSFGVNANATGSIVVRATDGPNAPPGLYYDTLRVYSNDGNYSGPNKIKLIFLAATVTTKGISINATLPLDAGSIRPGFTKVVTLPNVIKNASDCPTTIISVAFVSGVEFSLQNPITQQTVLPGQNFSVPIYFNPNGLCRRSDTLIVVFDATGSPLRIPVIGNGIEPGFATDPRDTLDFGNVVVGSQLDGVLKIIDKKAGSCIDSTKLISFSIVPNNVNFSTSFTIGSPTYIQPNNELGVTITAKPSAQGKRSAVALIKHEILGGSRIDSVVLVVNGVQASLAVVKNDIVFAPIDVGGKRDSSVKNFLQNQGFVDVLITNTVITGANSSDFTFTGPTSFAISRGTNKTLDLSFRPSAVGLRTATLELTTSIPSTIKINLSGSGDRPTIASLGSQVLFSPTAVNDCTDSVITKFLYNHSSVPLRITGTHIGGADSLYFSVVTPKIPPDTLVIQPGDSEAIRLKFCPARPGAHYAQLDLQNNSDATPFIVQLVGTGQSAQVVRTDTIAFEALRVLTSHDSSIKALIFNKQSGRLDVDSIKVIGADALSFQVISSIGPFSVAAHSDTAVSLRFNPMRRGRHIATLEVKTISQGIFEVPIIGWGKYPFLEIAPDNPANMRVRIGKSRRLRINITNAPPIGDDSSRIEKAAITGSTSFSNVSTGPFPARLLPGESIPIFVDFKPDRLCDHIGNVQLRGEGLRGTYAVDDTIVQFAGIGIAPMITSRNPEINFGSRKLNLPNDSTLNDFLGNKDFVGAIGNTCLDSTHIDSMTIVGPDAANFTLVAPVDPHLAQPLDTGNVLPFTIRFKPTVSGLNSAELLVYFDGRSDSVRRIQLLGAGTALPIEYGPAKNEIQLDFGKVHLDQSHDSSFTATNTSEAPLTIDQITTSRPDEFTILFPKKFPLVMQPGIADTIVVHFAPRDTAGERNAVVYFRSGILIDSAFALAGTGVRDLLRSASDTVDFGARAPGSINDTNVVLLNTTTVAFPNAALLGQGIIDTALIVSGTAYFDMMRYPQTVDASSQDSLTVRFRPFGKRASHNGLARVFFNKRSPAGPVLRDSFDIVLTGFVDSPGIPLKLGLGANQDGAPNTTVRFPITLSGDVDSAAINDLGATISYRSMLLRPVEITSAQTGITATLDSSSVGRARIKISSSSPFITGTLATIGFEALLGDTLETMLRYDSIATPGRVDLVFSSDSASFSIANFCNAQRRLIRFNSLLKLSGKPNPSTGHALLEYTLPAITDVQLSIYDESGKEIDRLASGIYQPGQYSVPLDLSECGDGTYYCILTAGRFTQTITLHVLK